MNSKNIGTFEEWLKEEKSKKLNEQNLEIQVDWWDQAIVEVMQELEKECNGCLDFDLLTDFIKAKFAILGRTWDEYIDNLYILHIKDLIFQFHGLSFCEENTSDNATLHAKGVVIEQLAEVIYDKVIEKTGFPADQEPTIRIADRQSSMMVPVQPIPVASDDDGEGYDIPESKKVVKKYLAYTRQLNEEEKKIERDNLDGCTAYCIDRIEKEVGSLDPDAIFDAAFKYAPPQVKSRMVLLYVAPMVQDYLSKNALIVADSDDSAASKEMIAQAIEDMSFKMADDVLYALFKINGGVDVEVE